MKPVRADRVRGALLAAAAAAMLGAPSAHGAITVGSPLSGTFDVSTNFGFNATAANSPLLAPGANPVSPIAGTVVRWRLLGISGAAPTGGPFRLRVLRPAGGINYTGAGTSSPQTPIGAGLQTFGTSLPIQPGDLIGLDGEAGSVIGAKTVPGASYLVWLPPLADGSTRASATDPDANTELGFNADVEPLSDISFGKVKRNRRRGTATVRVNVPNPGTLDLSGKGVVKQRGAESASASKVVSAAGVAKLRVKAKGKRKRKLNRTGKVRLRLNVTFTPTNGSPNTETRRLRLRKRL